MVRRTSSSLIPHFGRVLPFVIGIILLFMNSQYVDAHFFGETKQVDKYQIIFAPYPTVPQAGSNSTYLNFSILANGTNIFNIHAALVITDTGSGEAVAQVPYKPYEFSDISIPYSFSEPGNYAVTLQARIIGDEKYQSEPLIATFDLPVERPGQTGLPIDELLLFYVTPAAVAIAGIAVYLHSKKKI